MSERRTIGQILMGMGRVTEEEVGRALEYQRDHGGYFGEALLACGVLSQGELDWGLASQFDLPYVFPDADRIDMEAASLVSPEWALAHLTLPIMKTDERLTVVVDSPMRTSAVQELQARTDLEIELALASAANIREVIRQVYARGAAAEQGERPLPVHLTDALGLVTDAGSTRFGISIRGRRSWIWWDDAGTIHRRPLEGLWKSELEQLMDPSAVDRIGSAPQARWEASLTREGIVTSVDVRYLGDESGQEYLFRPTQERSVVQERFTPPVPGILSEIRMLARSGSARFVVTAEPDGLGHELLPHLPALLLDSSWRSIHINTQDQAAAEGAFSLRMPADPDQWATELETLRAFHFDVVTVDLSGNQADWTSSALDVASVAFLLWPMADDRRPARDAGIRWELHVTAGGEDRLDWSLEPLYA